MPLKASVAADWITRKVSVSVEAQERLHTVCYVYSFWHGRYSIQIAKKRLFQASDS